MIKVRKLTAIILCLVMVLGTSTAFGAEPNLISAKADYNGHWAEATIEKWLNEGKVSGYPDGSFKPDAKVTRAEFVKIVNGIIDFDGKGSISYSDVSSSDWFYDYVSVAQEIGYIQGYAGKFQPNDYITREQAAAILARIQYLDDNKDSAGKFDDSGKISSWAAGSVGASLGAGFIKGYEDGEFRPQGNLTRAEAITMLDNVLENAKNYVIYKAGTQLKDYTAEGDLIVAGTVGDGDVTLDNVTVAGQLKVLGGGSNSVHLNNVKAVKIIVGKEGVRLVLGEGTTAQELTVSENAVLENNGAEIAKITISADGKVTLSGVFDQVVVEGEGGIVLDNAEIKVLTIEKAITISGEGTIGKLAANADGIKYEADVKIDKVELGEGVTEEPSKAEDTPSGGGGGGTPDGGDDDDEYKLIVSVSTTRTSISGEVTSDNFSYHSFNDYKGTEKISSVVGEEIKSIIEQLNDENSYGYKAVNGKLGKINDIIGKVEQIKVGDSETEIYSNKTDYINWDYISKYLEDTSIELSDDIKGGLEDGKISVDDLVKLLGLYDSSAIEEDLAKTSAKLPAEYKNVKLTIDAPEDDPSESYTFNIGSSLLDLFDRFVEDLFSNDQLTSVDGKSYSRDDSYSTNEAKISYEIKVLFELQPLTK